MSFFFCSKLRWDWPFLASFSPLIAFLIFTNPPMYKTTHVVKDMARIVETLGRCYKLFFLENVDQKYIQIFGLSKGLQELYRIVYK